MIRDQIETMRQVFALLKRIHINPAYFVVPISLSIAAAMFEGVGITLLVPLLNGFLTMDFSFVTGMYGMSTILSHLPKNLTTDRGLFAVLMTFFIVSFFLRNILRYAATVSMTYLTTRSEHHLRKLLFESYLTFGKLFFDRTSVGHHNTMLSLFTMYAMRPLTYLEKFMQASFSLVVYGVIMFYISWQLTLISIPLFLLLHFAVRKIINTIRKLSFRIAENSRALGKTVVEILSLIPLVKAYGTQERERTRYAEISDRAGKLEFKKIVVQQAMRPIQETITLIAALILFGGMLYVQVRNNTSLAPSFLVYFYLVMNASGKFVGITSFAGDLASVGGPVKEVVGVFDTSDKFIIPNGHKTFSGLQRSIETKGLTFSYPGGRIVLQGLSVAFEKGKVTALVGATGAGKTTLISILLRYYDCPPGTVFIDGTDIRDFENSSLLSHIALVSQDTLLLHDTLRANIAYGKPEATDDEINDVIKRARLEEFIQGCPQGLATLVGDRGVKLSGGEKQRVSIARALLRRADILILDEATSSLDSKTESLIQEAVDEAIAGKTAIVIAHRLSTIKNADKIVVLESGRQIEEGTLDELLKKEGKFFGFWQQQKFSA